MSWGGDGDQSSPPRVLNNSWLSLMNLPPTFLWKWPPKKPKFNDVCVPFKHSKFAPECQKYILRGPDFKTFVRGHAPRPPRNLHFRHLHVAPVVQVFFFSFFAYSKAFATYLKPYWRPRFQKLLPEGMPPDPPSNLHFGRLQVARTVQVYFPSLPTPKVLPPT